VYENDLLHLASLVNHYIRCFRVELTLEEIEQIGDSNKKNYFDNYHKSSVIFVSWSGLLPTGRIGRALPAALQEMVRLMEETGNHDKQIHFVLSHAFGYSFLVTESTQKYQHVIQTVIEAHKKIPRKGISEFETVVRNTIDRDLGNVRIIDAKRFKELLEKLAFYSTNPEATLPPEFAKI
jgi:hypothetical protein